MSDRSRKEVTPPPLLLMPAGGGLTLTPPDQPNILMPIVQSVPALLDPEEEAEADSFVGQSSVPPGQTQRSSSPLQAKYFQSNYTTGHDPFAQVGSGQQPPSVVPAFVPSQIPPRVGTGVSPLPATTSHLAAAAPHSAAPPPPPVATAGSTNIYRHQGGRPQYAVPPIGSQPPATVFSSFATSNSQPPTAMVSPMTSCALPNAPVGYAQQQQFQSSSLNVQSLQDNSVQYTGGLYYQPIRHHWCYQQNQGDVEIWRPFSVLDSMNLEVAFNTCLQDSPNNTIVHTNGGRYDVNVGCRVRSPIYWNDIPVPVRRCSWFYKREGDNRYIPYEEGFAAQLENEYKKAMETGGWHRRLEFPGNVVIVMHNANVIVQFPASATPDEWGNVQGDQMRPRVVKRSVEDFATMEQGEREEVDHLVFIVPGIEDMFNSKGKSVEALVDDLRSNSLTLLNSHFTQAFQSKSVNRVEFLPIVWTQALQDGTLGLKEQVGSITLPSTSKLRHFINNTLVDTLFYTSPLFCQKISETVGSEMNRMFHIFLERNESFSGDVSVIGHSLGSVILFDLLLNQRCPGELLNNGDMNSPEQAPPPVADVQKDEGNAAEEEKEEITLETLLSNVGLQDKVSLFQEEQIDVESLIMCSENDLKDIGIPMGPRKKLLGFLKEEKERKEHAKEQAEKKKREEKEKHEREARAAADASNSSKVLSNGQYVTASYMQGQFGAGQLKINYPQLDFSPSALFALGSPIAVFLSLRGVQNLGEFFQLPTCARVYNIFHPFDPMAYRLEPLIRPNTSSLKPVQIAHYKGRKRLHLEFKEAVSRYGTDIKQKIIDSFKSTWNTINEFARAHRSDAKSSTMENEVQSEMDQMMSHIAQQQSEDDGASISSMAEDEINMGQLNEGQRVDYVLQEGPLESFNDYLFALASHSCYWESEDTALMLLKEIYSPLGFRPVMPGVDGAKLSRDSSLPPRFVQPPPMAVVTGTPGTVSSAGPFQTSGAYQTSPASFQPPGTILQGQQSSFGVPPSSQPPVGPPPHLFNPQSQHQLQPGFRKSPYVPPDFSHLPSTLNQASAGPPPMGPALTGGYRRGQQ